MSEIDVSKLNLIPCSEIEFELSDETVGYDLTVEDNFTFSTSSGVFIQDTMGVFVPISNEAQEEARKKMITATNNTSMYSPNFELTKEMLIGLFTLTYLDKKNTIIKSFTSLDEIKKLNIGERINCSFRGKRITTTAGRIIFNSFLPEYIDFVDEVIDKKKINNILSKLIKYKTGDYAKTIDILMREGFKYSTLYPQSISMDMLLTPEMFKLPKKQLSEEKDLGRQFDIVKKMEKDLIGYLKVNCPELYINVVSGAAKDIGQLRQVMICKGNTNDPSGKILPPIINSLNEGHTSESYFNAAAAARKGIIDRSLNTAHGGYAYRKMVYVMGNVEANIANADCGTKKTFKIKLSNDLFSRMPGRYVVENAKVVPISKEMIGNIINLRSPVYCQSKSICRTCFGDLLYQLNSKCVGIIAAQEVTSLSERIMKCSIGMIEYNGKLYSMEDIWKMS